MSQAARRWDLSYTQDRELSWLKFDQRVMEEAMDPSVPLIERLRFLSIFTSNLDEFFMVRVGSLFDLAAMAPKAIDSKSGLTPAQQLERIYDAVRPLIRQRDAVYAELSTALALRGVRDVPYDRLQGAEKRAVQDYYKEQIRPLLSPQIIDRSHPFPHLKNKVLYTAALLRDKDRSLLGIMEVPPSLPPIFFLPGDPCAFVRTEEILLAHMKKIFKLYHVEEMGVVSVTRNADLSYDSYDEKFDEASPDLLSHMAKLLRQRDRLSPVRLEMQADAPGLRDMLEKMLKLSPQQTFVCSCPLKLDHAYLLDGCPPSLYQRPHTPAYPPYLDHQVSMWEQVRQRDVLLFYPYHSMQPFLDLLKEAAADPKVLSIEMTIYRVARNSAVIKHLCTAAENGKSVTVLVELRARFDEKNNIEWARELEEAGCRLLYGSEGYKCHAKLCLITRKGKTGLEYVTQIGTGNYNEKTAALYTDFCLMTADPIIAADAVAFFQNMLLGDLQGSYRKLLVAPASMKSTLLRLMDGEIARGSQGHIILKANAVTERALIDKLAEASQAGVRVELIIRGICCLLPGIPGKTDNITVISIVGRFLEHSRVYCFGDGPLRQIYLSSADIMTRNQVNRVEAACPVESPELKAFLSKYLDVLLSDTRKSRRLLPSGDYTAVKDGPAPDRSSQEYWLEHPVELKPTVVHSPSLWKRLTGRFGRPG